MLSRVLATISRHALLARGDRVLVAISGGPDSTALLDVLARLRARLGIELHAGTIDHGLRPEAAGEAQAVAAACRARGVACEVERVDVAAHRARHVSLQDAARRARLDALVRLAARSGCARIALGHNADDQAETILFRILRGTGVAGLMGIPYERAPFIRPLLDVRRSEIVAHLRRKKLTSIEDPSNADRRFARSRIRHDLLPRLGQENPRVTEALLTLGASARALGEPRLPPTAAISAFPRLSPRLTARLAAMMGEGQGTRQLTVPGGTIEIRYGTPQFRANGEPGPGKATSLRRVEVRAPGWFAWPAEGGSTGIELSMRRGNEGPPRVGATFTAEIFSWGLTLRALQPGERMRPRGGRGSRKLQDLLVDAKVPRNTRNQLPALVASDGTVLFVPGLRPAEQGRPSPEDRSWIEIRVR